MSANTIRKITVKSAAFSSVPSTKLESSQINVQIQSSTPNISTAPLRDIYMKLIEDNDEYNIFTMASKFVFEKVQNDIWHYIDYCEATNIYSINVNCIRKIIIQRFPTKGHVLVSDAANGPVAWSEAQVINMILANTDVDNKGRNFRNFLIAVIKQAKEDSLLRTLLANPDMVVTVDRPVVNFAKKPSVLLKANKNVSVMMYEEVFAHTHLKSVNAINVNTPRAVFAWFICAAVVGIYHFGSLEIGERMEAVKLLDCLGIASKKQIIASLEKFY